MQCRCLINVSEVQTLWCLVRQGTFRQGERIISVARKTRVWLTWMNNSGPFCRHHAQQPNTIFFICYTNLCRLPTFLFDLRFSRVGSSFLCVSSSQHSPPILYCLHSPIHWWKKTLLKMVLLGFSWHLSNYMHKQLMQIARYIKIHTKDERFWFDSHTVVIQYWIHGMPLQANYPICR